MKLILSFLISRTIMYLARIYLYILYYRTITCVFRTCSPNLDDVIKSEREDLNKKTENLRQVNG